MTFRKLRRRAVDPKICAVVGAAKRSWSGSAGEETGREVRSLVAPIEREH